MASTLHFSVCSSHVKLSPQTVVASPKNTPRRASTCSCAAAPAGTSGSLYSVLGVNVDSSSADMKRAYKELARRYHPDVNPPETHDACTQKFVAVQQAYDVLSDPTKKAEYDYAMINQKKNPWRVQWERQLSRFHRKVAGATNAASSNTTWGARMRQKKNSESGGDPRYGCHS